MRLCVDDVIGPGNVRLARRLMQYNDGGEGRQDMFDYIKMFYIPISKHVRNGMLPSVAVERQRTLMAHRV